MTDLQKELKERLKLTLVISRQEAAPRSLIELADLAFVGGVTAIQLREKDMLGKDFYQEALELGDFCRSRKALFIINDRLDIALAAKADGLHLGQDDLPLNAIRHLAPELIIGVSAHNEVESQKAISDGANYLGLGALFPTGSKADVNLIAPETVRKINQYGCPTVGIGGIGAQNSKQAWQLGLTGLAVISALAASSDPTLAAKEILQAKG